MTAHIQIVGANHRSHLDACLRSCVQQTIRVPVLYVDNASADGSVDYVRQHFPDVRVHANAQNRGYSGGHNDGLHVLSKTEVVVVLNPDVVLEPDFVEKGIACFARPSVGAVVPLLLRCQETGAHHSTEDVWFVDSYGTRLLRSLRAVNQYEGAPLTEVSTPLPPPWGFSGAAVFLRRAALHDVAVDGEIFDEDFFAYREDVDLSWRLRLRGWEIDGATVARAWHVRAARTGKKKSARVGQLSWRNYFLTLVKDVPRGALVRHGPAIVLENCARGIWMLLSPSLWPALSETLRLLPRMLVKRAKVFARASAAPYAAGNVPRRAGKFPDGRTDYRYAATAPVLSCVVRRGPHILLAKRSDKVGSYKGWWHIIGGYLDRPDVTVEQHALIELQEELGIPHEAVGTVRGAEPFTVFDPDVAKTWEIHPVLVVVRGDQTITLNWEHTAYRWVRPEDVASYRPIPTVHEVLRRLSIVSIEVEPL